MLLLGGRDSDLKQDAQDCADRFAINQQACWHPVMGLDHENRNGLPVLNQNVEVHREEPFKHLLGDYGVQLLVVKDSRGQRLPVEAVFGLYSALTVHLQELMA